VKPATHELLTELMAALSAAGMHADAEEIRRFAQQLDSASQLERKAAARHISDRCHVKWYGDCNLPVKREGDYADLNFLAAVRAAVQSEVK